MNEPINDGGPAFACDSHKQFPTQEGMSLRDYFAAMALGRCLDEFWEERNGDEAAAAAAYRAADAMLAERSKPTKAKGRIAGFLRSK